MSDRTRTRPSAFVVLLASFTFLISFVPVFAGSTCGIFVSTSTGSDGPTSGLAPNDPCATISHAISRAQVEALDCVFVQAGTYAEVVDLADGISVIGGFDTNWVQDSHSTPGHTVRIEGGFDVASQQWVAVTANGLTLPTVVSNLVIAGPTASGDLNGDGNSSYGVRVINSVGLALQDLSIESGDGAAGVDGNAGADASLVSATSGMNGGIGQSGAEFVTSCDATSRGSGGGGGSNPAAPATGGGGGGAGGTMDTNCTAFPCGVGGTDCAATSGLAGLDATTSGLGYGQGGAPGSPCGGGSDGLSGRIVNGSAGNGGPTGGVLLGFAWFGNSGTPGGIGAHGGGGGGGGGSGGCDTGTDEYGAGGGGGGAGGERAAGGGEEGGGGGGSFGVFAIGSAIDVTNCEIARGNGGDGGRGGAGGRGQDGGTGGPGGTGFDSGPAGDGGHGGHGGHGGGGGGGAGGDSWGIWAEASTVNTSAVAYMSGAAGQGAVGGVSAPGAPGPVNDGLDGLGGANGTVGTLLLIPGPPAPPAGSTGGIVLCDPACLALDASVTDVLPGKFGFDGLHPNPAGVSSAFSFALPAPADVRLDLFDVSGRRVGTVVDRMFAAGAHRVRWDGRGAGGRLGSGIYWARLRAGRESIVRKITLVD